MEAIGEMAAGESYAGTATKEGQVNSKFDGLKYLKDNNLLDEDGSLDIIKIDKQNKKEKRSKASPMLAQMIVKYNSTCTEKNIEYGETGHTIRKTLDGKNLLSYKKVVETPLKKDWEDNRGKVLDVLNELPVLGLLGKWDKKTPYNEFPSNKQLLGALRELLKNGEKCKDNISNEMKEAKTSRNSNDLLHYMKNKAVLEEILEKDSRLCATALRLQKKVTDKESDAMMFTLGAVTIGFIAGGGILSAITTPIAVAVATTLAGGVVTGYFINNAKNKRDAEYIRTVNRLDDKNPLGLYSDLDKAEDDYLVERLTIVFEALGLPAVVKGFKVYGKSAIIAAKQSANKAAQNALRAAKNAPELVVEQTKKVGQAAKKGAQAAGQAAKKAKEFFTDEIIKLLVNNTKLSKFAEPILKKFPNGENQKLIRQILSLMELKNSGIEDISKLKHDEIALMLKREFKEGEADELIEKFTKLVQNECGCDLSQKVAVCKKRGKK